MRLRHPTFRLSGFLLGLGLLVAPPAVRPAAAADGFLDQLFGGHASAVPPNPFASNYASAPPSPEAVREQRERRARRDGRSGEAGLVPPGRIPE